MDPRKVWVRLSGRGSPTRSEVEASCERFLRTVGYQGLCGIELKCDPRDGMAKLIEINPRYGLWDDIGVPVGVDLAGEAVRSLFGAATEPSRPTDFRQKWVEITRDLPAAMAYRKESLLSVMGWAGHGQQREARCDQWKPVGRLDAVEVARG